MPSKFEEPGTIKRPEIIGRAVRFVYGVAMLALFTWIGTSYEAFLSPHAPSSPILVLILVGSASALFNLPHVVNIGFTVSWGQRAQLVLGLLAAVAVGCDFLRFGSLWGPPLGLLVFVLLTYVTAHSGLSFIVASLLATPG